MDEDKERQARKIRLKIMRLQKELASSQHHASLGSFLQAGRPSNLRNQAERDRIRLEEEIASLREQLEILTPSEGPAKKTAAPKKEAAAEKKSTKEKAAPKKTVKKKAAPKKAASKKTVKTKASPKKAKKSR
jgi:hypothetical protein